MIAPPCSIPELNPEVTDEALMQLIQEGEQWAIDQFYRRCRAKLLNVILNIVHDDAEAQDVLQETLLQVWNEAKHYSPRLGKPIGWVCTIAKRRAIDRIRRLQSYGRARDRFEVFVAHEPRSWMRGQVDADVCSGDLEHFVRKQISHLPPSQREAIELSYFGGLSHREIASRTRIPLGTIKTRLELGLKKLTQTVRPYRAKI